MSSRRSALGLILTVALLLPLIGASAAAQELEPGAYQNAPTGTNVGFASYAFSTGNILLDTALPVEGAHARIHLIGLGYLRTLNVFGKSAKLDVQLPVSWGRFEGVVAGEFRVREPRGLADPRVRLSVNLLGAPALDLPSFVKYQPRTILGAAVQVVLPLGQYDAERLVNLGANRWSTRAELGLSHTLGRLTLEAAGGAWFFTDNDDYFDGSTLSQRPLTFIKGSAIYSFRRSLWASVSYGHAEGGETRLDGLLRNDLQRNDRVGVTLSLPVGRTGSVKFSYTSGLTTRLGADFDSFGIGYQYSWRTRARTATTAHASARGIHRHDPTTNR